MAGPATPGTGCGRRARSRDHQDGVQCTQVGPIPDPWRAYISKYEEDLTVEGVAAVRAAVGPDVDLLVEAHRRLAPMHAVRVARRIEQFNPFWYEEPVSARTCRRWPPPSGTSTSRSSPARRYTQKPSFARSSSYAPPTSSIQTSATPGGILELKEIAAMAETYYVVVSPHNFNSTTVGLAATLHLCATIPNFLITEYFVNLAEIGEELATNPIKVENGYIQLPTTPGLGIELDEDALARHPYTEPALRSIRHPGDEGPLTTGSIYREASMNEAVTGRGLETLDDVLEKLREHLPNLRGRYGVSGLWLFGSYVRNEQTQDSDLDVLIEFSETPGLFKFVRLERELSDLLGINVDLVTQGALKPNIFSARPRPGYRGVMRKPDSVGTFI